MTTTNLINMTSENFIAVVPFDLDSETATRYLENLNSFRTKTIDGNETYHLWQHMESLKQAISWLHDDLNDVVMSVKVFLHDMNFPVSDYIYEQLILELTNFQEDVLASEDHFKSWQLNLAFARVVESYVIEEIDNYEVN